MMLQADEIIQQKQWHELNAAERLSIIDLADNEGSFNMLKKMMAVSIEEKHEVPPVSETLYDKIVPSLPVAKRRSAAMYWMAAAASLAIMLSIFFFLKKEETKNDIVAIPSPTDTPLPQKNLVLQEHTDTPHLQHPTPVNNVPVLVQKQKSKPAFDNNDYSNNLQDTTQHTVYAVATTVAANPSLLDFITEAE